MNLFKRNFSGEKNRQNESSEDSGCGMAEVKTMLAQAYGASPFFCSPRMCGKALKAPTDSAPTMLPRKHNASKGKIQVFAWCLAAYGCQLDEQGYLYCLETLGICQPLCRVHSRDQLALQSHD